MTTEKKLWVAFGLNLGFALLEAVGGVWTGSVAILSDALHDVGDAAAIGVAGWMQRKSCRQADERHTCGYGRFGVIGGAFTAAILLIGAIAVVAGAIRRLLSPAPVHYEGMLIIAFIGLAVNGVAAYVTHGGRSVNQRAVNLHMLEDVLGWAVVLVGAAVMWLTEWHAIDPLLSIAVAFYLLTEAFKTLREAIHLLTDGTPDDVDIAVLRHHLQSIDGVQEVCALRIRSLDGVQHEAAVQMRVCGDAVAVKARVREELAEHGFAHVTVETLQEEEAPYKPLPTTVPRRHHHHH